MFSVKRFGNWAYCTFIFSFYAQFLKRFSKQLYDVKCSYLIQIIQTYVLDPALEH